MAARMIVKLNLNYTATATDTLGQALVVNVPLNWIAWIEFNGCPKVQRWLDNTQIYLAFWH